MYRSRIGAFIAITMGVSIVVSCIAVVFCLRVADTGAMAVAALISVSSVVLPAWMLMDTSYQLTNGLLKIRCGPFRWKFPLADIRSVARSRSWLSGPALSLRRLRLGLDRHREVLISPLKEQEFIGELVRLNPSIKVTLNE